jgi:hypothetical protein
MIGMYNANAQDAEKTVTITCSGSGKTQEEAKQNALRSAIEQAFGTFISSKTEVLNDNIVSDQITSVASGNIKSFSIESEIKLPTETWSVTIKSIVSINKLINFAESKGFNTELKGGLFAMNIKQKILNEESEPKAILNILPVVHELMQNAFDYKVTTLTPTAEASNNNLWNIELKVQGFANKNMIACSEYFLKTLQALSLSKEEVTDYLKINKNVYILFVNHLGKQYPIYLRNKLSIRLIERVTELNKFYATNFTVKEKKLGQVMNFLPLPDFSFDAYEPVPKQNKIKSVGNYFFFGNDNGHHEGLVLDYDYSGRCIVNSGYYPHTNLLFYAPENQHLEDTFAYDISRSYLTKKYTIQFLKIGDLGCSMSSTYQYKLNEIENIEGFDIVSNGNVLPFKRNGLLFKDSLNNEFVLSIIQPEEGPPSNSRRDLKNCYRPTDTIPVYNVRYNLANLEDLKTQYILGEKNWRLPTWEEGKAIFKFIYTYGLYTFWDIQAAGRYYYFLTMDKEKKTDVFRIMTEEEINESPSERWESNFKLLLKENQPPKLYPILVKTNELP